MQKTSNIVRIIFSLLFIVLLFTSCNINQQTTSLTYNKENLENKRSLEFIVSKLVHKASNKILNTVMLDEHLLVSDYVNLQNLENKSQLGFFLSSITKDKLLQLNILVKEVELRKDFTLGDSGFNLLSRNSDEILNKTIKKSKYALIGTYSMTSKTLNIFLKLINIGNGIILASSHESTPVTSEIIELENSGRKQKEYNKPAIRPHLVL